MNGSNPPLWRSECIAVAIAIGSVVLGLLIVRLAKANDNSLESSVLIALMLLPLLAYLVSSGRLAELKAPGGIEAKLVAAARA